MFVCKRHFFIMRVYSINKIKNILLKVFPVANYTFFCLFVDATSKSLCSLIQTNYRDIFVHFLSHRWKQVVVGKSRVWWRSCVGGHLPLECFRSILNRPQDTEYHLLAQFNFAEDVDDMPGSTNELRMIFSTQIHFSSRAKCETNFRVRISPPSSFISKYILWKSGVFLPFIRVH